MVILFFKKVKLSLYPSLSLIGSFLFPLKWREFGSFTVGLSSREYKQHTYGQRQRKKEKKKEISTVMPAHGPQSSGKASTILGKYHRVVRVFITVFFFVFLNFLKFKK